MKTRLEENRFFDCFEAVARRRLAAQARPQAYADGDMIFTEASHPGWVYLISSGHVQLVKGGGRGDAVVIAAVDPGDYFGEIGVLYRENHLTGARAKGEVLLHKIAGLELRKVLAAEPAEVTRRLSMRVLDYLRAIDERFVAETLRKEKMHLIGEVAGAIIHDLRNPLMSIRLAACVVSELHKDAETTRCARVVSRQAERMAGMAQELLEFARGTMALKREETRLRDLFEDFRALNEDFLKSSKVRLTLEPAEGSIVVDKDRLLRVLQNLVGNSVDALAGKGGAVHLSARRAEDRVEISIRDDGPGIPESVRKRMFEPFVTSGKSSGTGLGLAIAKNLVEAHGGTISISSRAGQGTTVRVQLPQRP